MSASSSDRLVAAGSASADRPRNAERKRLREARTLTARRRSAGRLNIAGHEALQEVLDGLVQDLRFTQKMCDALDDSPSRPLWRDTMVGRLPNEWIRLRDHYREQVGHLALSIEAKGLAERSVRVQEAQAVMMAQMIREAAERAGLDASQINRLGDELRTLAQETSQAA